MNINTIVSILLVILTLATWCLVYHGAYWEPFYVYATSDALLYIGGAFVLLTLLLELAGMIVYAIATRRLSPWWSVSLVWVALLCWVSVGISKGWTDDQEHFHRSLPSSIETHR